MNKQQLASKIWQSANKMRSKIEANEYKDYILGFIFYKYLSEKELKYLKDNEWTDEYLSELNEDDEETVKNIQQNLGYFISYDNLFSTWIEKGSDFDVQNVRVALSAFNRLINPTHKKVFEGIFDTLQTGLSKLGDSSASQSKAISELIYLIKDIPMDGKQDYDVLGFIYEYLIGMFAANAGKKAGEFYTPHEVSLVMSEIIAHHLKERDEIKIYDPTSGSGSLLINIGKSISQYGKSKNNIKYYAQELKQNTYNLTRMNLIMRGILPDNIVTRNGDTLEDDWPFFDESDPLKTYDPVFVDAVVSNPPYSQAWNPENKEMDPRYAEYGIAPKGKADYAFLLHDLFHMRSDGIMTIVLPHGVLFRGGEEGTIRKNLIEKGNIDTIIGLPANIFYGTGIPTIIIVLKKNRPNSDILIIDASKGFEKVGKNNKLRASDIKKIVDTVKQRQTIDGFSRVVSRDEIRNNDYNLNIPRYVDSSDKNESYDIYASMFGGIPHAEIDELKEYWEALPDLKATLFVDTSPAYSQLKVENIKTSIMEHSDVKKFKNRFFESFAGMEADLYNRLIENFSLIHVSREEEALSENIFKRLENIPLIDKYEAYQLLDNHWNQISGDLEILQMEGLSAAKVVDPKMVVKKKGNKEEEIQDGWMGRIIPFELIQNQFLTKEKEELKKHENRLSEITMEYEEIFESLTEDEKECEFAGENGFVNAEVKKALKEGVLAEDTLDKLCKVESLNNEEKMIKALIKKETAKLENLTKDRIEHLSDDEAMELLQEKWIQPLMNSLFSLPDKVIKSLATKVNDMAKKYETTLADINRQIQETEAELCAMIDELEGNEFDMLGLQEFKKLMGGM